MITDNKGYQEALKRLVNLKFQYAITGFGNTFIAHIRQIVQEKSVLGAEINKITGSTFLDVTVDDIVEAKRIFILQCRQAQEETPLFLEYLLDVFGADDFEKHCIRLMFVFELDKCYATMAALLQDGWEYGYVTPYLAQLTYEEEIDSALVYAYFSESGILQRFFVDIGQREKMVLLNRIELKMRMLDFAMGNVSLYPKYLKFLKKREYHEPLEQWIGEDKGGISFLEEVLEYREDKKEQIIYIYGEQGSGKKLSVLTACQKKKENCFLIDLDECQKTMELMDASDENGMVDDIVRELILFQAVPVVVSHTNEKSEVAALLEERKLLLKQLLRNFSILFLCMEQKVHIEESYPVTYLYRNPMSLLEAKKFWEVEAQKYVLEDDMSIGDMANKFVLTQGKIKTILKNAEKKTKQKKESCISREAITEECYEVIEQSMGKKAVKVKAVYRMEDLILPSKQKQKLLDACNQVKYKHQIYEEWGFEDKVSYGKGVTMAFIGPPGTGKTMAAQVIAAELGMELYKVELSGIVSKYVGETEKNLDEIFEQARKSQVILFFDEADALFSKRSEGKETTDKYSNMEASFLLQKMEGYEGITILATNLFHHFDEAFKRRLKMIVEFPMPDEKDRRRLWQTMIPQKMETGEIDFDYLAKQFELSGSNIKNILIHSAFLAASKGKFMDMEDIIPAIQNEYAKNGKNLLKDDVLEYYMYLNM